jgi:hypothetical protein
MSQRLFKATKTTIHAGATGDDRSNCPPMDGKLHVKTHRGLWKERHCQLNNAFSLLSNQS